MRKNSLSGIVAVVAILVVAFGAYGAEPAKIEVTSEAITDGQPIPITFTGDGEDVSPALSWSGVPEGTKEIAVVCDDPDAPTPQPWVHWVIYSIPGTAKGLPEGLSKDATLSEPDEVKGVQQGNTGWREPGYRGPSPPSGKVHHYHFTVYALDADLDLKPGLDKKGLLAAIDGHIIGKGELVGTYERK